MFYRTDLMCRRRLTRAFTRKTINKTKVNT
nr:MAG TPA: hypothetical protein [Caudoviricetes sp.]